MRCVECQTDPLTPEHYCECCGRKLSLQERKGPETAAAPVAPPSGPTAPAEPAASAVRCDSCGGPSHNGNLCASCQHAFQPFLNSTFPQTPASDLPATVAETTPVVEASPATELVQSGPLPRVSQWFDVPDIAAETLPSPVLAEVVMRSQGDPEAAAAEAARREAAGAEAARLNAAQAEAARIEVDRIEIAKLQAAKAQAATNRVAQIETRRPAPRAATPAAASQRSGPSVQPRQGTGSIVRVAAALVIVAATGLGVGAYVFKIQGLPIPGQAQWALVAPTAAVAERVSTSQDPLAVVEGATKAREATSARERATPARTTAAPKAKSATSSGVPPRVAPKAQLTAPTRQVASAFAPAGVTEAPVHEAAPPPLVLAPPPPAPSTAPLRPFFETKEVNESPRVASRVEPQLPDDLRARELNDVVVVRLLVSQSGHPSSLSLLRRSRAGQSLDDAVVVAVKQWTFSPARKKGEAVSCWLNVGVPVGRAN